MHTLIKNLEGVTEPIVPEPKLIFEFLLLCYVSHQIK